MNIYITHKKTHSFPRIYTTTENHHHPLPDLPQATTRQLGTDLPHPQPLDLLLQAHNKTRD
jgi:hypothetical protein